MIQITTAGKIAMAEDLLKRAEKEVRICERTVEHYEKWATRVPDSYYLRVTLEMHKKNLIVARHAVIAAEDALLDLGVEVRDLP
jgi:hypothetical protein